MTTIPLIPDSAPFTAEQRSWLNGFLAGVLSRGEAAVTAPEQEKRPLLVLFGSQSGNAESLAKKLGKEAAAKGFAARVNGMEAVSPSELSAASNLLVITSTWGEGDMPDNAASLWQGLNQNGSSPTLAGVKYSVFALGDKNYGDTFCLAGKRFDERLEVLGATRVHPRADCDVDFDAPFAQWSQAVLVALAGESASSMAVETAIAEAPVAEEGYGKKRPFPAPLLECRRLNGPGSAKDTRHVAFSLEGSGLAYETGDALGLFPRNCPEVVEAIMAARGFDPATEVALPDGGTAPLNDALLGHYDIRQHLGAAPTPGQKASEFVASLRKLQPRLYSISSSPKAHPGEVHLTVAAVRYERDGLAHKGVASIFLADRLALGETAGVFIHTAKHFRLPTDGDLPIIMVGPGTGIAPFRAFLEERQAIGAKGKNWLFFGDQTRAADFLYAEQMEAWMRDGHLAKLDTAFSRDQAKKIYVQQRMIESGAALWQWLEEGAHFYVCGDASRMAKDVDAALHEIVRTHSGKSADATTAYVAELKKTKRYARDVY